jgi:hypothetical protein
VLQEVFQSQVAHNEEIIPEKTPGVLQDLFSVQPAVVVGLISMMTGSVLQEDIVSAVGVLVRKALLKLHPYEDSPQSNSLLFVLSWRARCDSPDAA